MNINGHGAADPEIMLIGDYGSKEDLVKGYALSGSTERLLRSWFQEHSYHLSRTYRTLLIKDTLSYDGNNKKRFSEAITEAHAKIGAEGLDYFAILKGEIYAVRPNIIVPLGELSLNAITGQRGIRKFRGSMFPLGPQFHTKDYGETVKVIPVLGPRDLLSPKDEKMKVVSALDIGKVVANAYNGEKLKEDYHVWIADSAEAVRNYFLRNMDVENVCVFDIETKHNIPDCIGFCCDGVESMVVPLLGPRGSHDYAFRWWHIANFLASNKPKVNQNIKYDVGILERFGFDIGNIYGDTSLRAHLLYAEFDKNLGFLNSLYTTLPYFKDEGKEFDPAIHDVKRRYTYCGKDCISTWRIYNAQRSEIIETNQVQQEATLMEHFHIYRKIERNGILIDAAQQKKLIDKYRTLKYVYQTELDKLVGYQINVDSPKQVGEWVYVEMQFPPRKKRDTGAWDTGEETLEELYILHSEECINTNMGPRSLRLILIGRKLNNLLEFLHTPVHLDNRMRGSYRLNGTSTFRTSCGKSNDRTFYIEGWNKKDDKPKLGIHELGHSLQTIGKHGFKVGDKVFGKDIRSMFVPTPGYIFVEGDGSQAEARIDSVLARDFEFLQEFDRKPGVHCLTGSWVFECDPNDIKKGTEEYHIGKTVRHAGERNMKAPRLAMMIQRELSFCIPLLDRFHARQPNIRNVFHREIRDVISKNGDHTLISPHGFRRVFFGRENDDTVNEAISFIPQATVSIQTRSALAAIDAEIPSARVLAEMHDGILAEIHKDDLEKYSEIFKRCTESPINFRNCTLSRDFELSIPYEINTSETHWGDLG